MRTSLHYLGAGPHAPPVVHFLAMAMEQARESQCDKWYESPFVVWYFFSRALSAVAPELRPLMLRRLASAAPSDPLETALMACSLAYWNEPYSVDGILGRQLESGGWPSRRCTTADVPGAPTGPSPRRTPTPSLGFRGVDDRLCIEALSRSLSGR